MIHGTTTYKQSYPHGGANPTSRPFPGNDGGPVLVVPDGKPAGMSAAEVISREAVRGTILATKKAFPERISAADPLGTKESAIDRDFTTNYCTLGKAAPEGHRDIKASGKPLNYFTSGGILGFTNTGKPLADRQPLHGTDDYAQGSVLLPDGSKADFTTVHKASYSGRTGKEAQKAFSARHAGKHVQESDVVLPPALKGAHPDVRARQGKLVKGVICPDGSIRYDVTTSNGCMAGKDALEKSCSRTVQKPRNTGGLRADLERKWQKQINGSNAGSKAASTTISVLPAGFQSSKSNERSQRNAKYGVRMQPLFEDDVKLERPLPKEYIVVPEADGVVCFETTTGTAHCDPYGRMSKARAKGASEASAVSGFSAGGSQAGSQIPVDNMLRSEVSHVSGFSASLMS